ncbi:LysR substrate-binding domain-containing protein, partial [Klebsiella quasipneumoniae]
QILVSHFSSRNIDREQIIERLFTAECDLLISIDPVIVPGIDNQLIDSFKSFVCICSGSHMLSQLSQLSLHHFYTLRHAQYQSGTSIPMVINDSALQADERWYKAKRNIGYRSDSINGLIGMVERSSLIALIPLKIALFYKNQRKYDIKIIQPPPELTFRPIQVYASW